MNHRSPFPPLHPRLKWLQGLPEGRAWLERLPQLVQECQEQWSLTLEKPFADAYTSFAVPAGEVVLKIQFPHRESEYEADALEVWNGDGAIRLLALDRERHALLLERCRPGVPLRTAGTAVALDVLIELLPRLWKPADGPFTPLVDEAARWSGSLPTHWERSGRPFEQALLDVALAGLDELPKTQGEQVLIHQDLHADNVLSTQREPWLAIDPKPLTGEREFSLAPIVRSFELGGRREDVLYRLTRLTHELQLDPDRVRRWTIAQTLAWSFDSDHRERHVQTARWLVEAG